MSAKPLKRLFPKKKENNIGLLFHIIAELYLFSSSSLSFLAIALKAKEL